MPYWPRHGRSFEVIVLGGIGVAGFGTTGAPVNPPKHKQDFPFHPATLQNGLVGIVCSVWWSGGPFHLCTAQLSTGFAITVLLQRFSGIKIDDKSAAQTRCMCAARSGSDIELKMIMIRRITTV